MTKQLTPAAREALEFVIDARELDYELPDVVDLEAMNELLDALHEHYLSIDSDSFDPKMGLEVGDIALYLADVALNPAVVTEVLNFVKDASRHSSHEPRAYFGEHSASVERVSMTWDDTMLLLEVETMHDTSDDGFVEYKHTDVFDVSGQELVELDVEMHPSAKQLQAFLDKVDESSKIFTANGKIFGRAK